MTRYEKDQTTRRTVAEALRVDRVALAFQPVVRADGDRRPAFYEALIRLFDRAGQVIPAARFIHAIDSHPLGREIDRAALGLTLTELTEDPSLRLSVNLSPRSIGCKRWMTLLESRLAEDPMLGERLIIEITEHSAVQSPEKLCRFMAALQARGISFALDDFGAGQTSFRHLRAFRFDIVKIDGLFSRGIARDRDNQALIRAMVGLSRHFEMFTVAEHVETDADAERLTELGVDCLQGYRFGAPAISSLRARTARRMHA